MSAKRAKKLCWNCEGSVDHEAIHCLYCGVSLTPSENKSKPASHPTKPSSSIPFPPYSSQQNFASWEAEPPIESDEEPVSPLASVPIPGPLTTLPYLLLLPGVVFLLFALILLFFSDEGLLTLQWNAHYWFVYLLISLPLLIFGWKFLKEHSAQDH